MRQIPLFIACCTLLISTAIRAEVDSKSKRGVDSKSSSSVQQSGIYNRKLTRVFQGIKKDSDEEDEDDDSDETPKNFWHRTRRQRSEENSKNRRNEESKRRILKETIKKDIEAQLKREGDKHLVRGKRGSSTEENYSDHEDEDVNEKIVQKVGSQLAGKKMNVKNEKDEMKVSKKQTVIKKYIKKNKSQASDSTEDDETEDNDGRGSDEYQERIVKRPKAKLDKYKTKSDEETKETSKNIKVKRRKTKSEDNYEKSPVGNRLAIKEKRHSPEEENEETEKKSKRKNRPLEMVRKTKYIIRHAQDDESEEGAHKNMKIEIKHGKQKYFKKHSEEMKVKHKRTPKTQDSEESDDTEEDFRKFSQGMKRRRRLVTDDTRLGELPTKFKTKPKKSPQKWMTREEVGIEEDSEEGSCSTCNFSSDDGIVENESACVSNRAEETYEDEESDADDDDNNNDNDDESNDNSLPCDSLTGCDV